MTTLVPVTSASSSTHVPHRLIGPVAPDTTIGAVPMGMPASANTSAIESDEPMKPSGLMVSSR